MSVQSEWLDKNPELDVYCIYCKKKGKAKDLRKSDGSYPFIYDGAYECDDCKSFRTDIQAGKRCPYCGGNI